MTRRLFLQHPCGWHEHPSGWYKGFTTYADWAADVESIWPSWNNPDLEIVLAIRCIGQLFPGHIPPLYTRELHDDLKSIAKLKKRLGIKILIYEGAAQDDFQFQREWGTWTAVMSEAQPDMISWDAVTTEDQAKFYGDLSKNLNVPDSFEPYNKPELSLAQANGAFQIDGYNPPPPQGNGDWNWDVCLKRMRNGVDGYDRESLKNLWYQWITMPSKERESPNVNQMTEKAITEALSCGIRNIGLNLAHVKEGAFLNDTLRWLEGLQLPI